MRLWKAVVELSSEDDARVLLARAVECCPQHVELWLALARLETYDNARRVLNKARETVPTDASIWITAAKLEEANGNVERLPKILERAIKSLVAAGVSVDREFWLKEAEAAEKSEPPSMGVCRAIVLATIGAGVEEEDRKRTWIADAEDCLKRGSVQTARTIFEHAISVFPGKKGVWLRAAQLEKAHGTYESLDALLRRAVTFCPQAEILWLMGAKERWLAGDVPGAREVLQEAFASNPDSEDIWLAAFKLEFENGEHGLARSLLARAREGGGTERMWMKSAILEREVGDAAAERALLDQGLAKFPGFFKLWLMLGQLEERQGRIDAAREVFSRAVKRCPTSHVVWRSAAGLEERAGNPSKARAILEQARMRMPKTPELWLAAVRVELASGNAKAAEATLAKALQDCPHSGILWATAVDMAPRPQRKSKSVDALKRCDNDPHVVLAIAHLFWQDRKVDKARSWFNRAVTLLPDVGDFWAHYLRFERQYGTEEQRTALLARCASAEPHHGERWQELSKRVEHAHKKVPELLALLADALEQEARAAARAGNQ